MVEPNFSQARCVGRGNGEKIDRSFSTEQMLPYRLIEQDRPPDGVPIFRYDGVSLSCCCSVDQRCDRRCIHSWLVTPSDHTPADGAVSRRKIERRSQRRGSSLGPLRVDNDCQVSEVDRVDDLFGIGSEYDENIINGPIDCSINHMLQERLVSNRCNVLRSIEVGSRVRGKDDGDSGHGQERNERTVRSRQFTTGRSLCVLSSVLRLR